MTGVGLCDLGRDRVRRAWPLCRLYAQQNADHMLRVIRNHRQRRLWPPKRATRLWTVKPVAHWTTANCPDPVLVGIGQKHLGRSAADGRASTAIRNAQATVIAPTGTIGLVMDCDTTGIEPDFALVKFKKLAGGGYFKIINRSVPVGARNAWAIRLRSDRRDRCLRRRSRHTGQCTGHQSHGA